MNLFFFDGNKKWKKKLEKKLARVQTVCYNNTAVCGSIGSADENENSIYVSI